MAQSAGRAGNSNDFAPRRQGRQERREVKQQGHLFILQIGTMLPAGARSGWKLLPSAWGHSMAQILEYAVPPRRLIEALGTAYIDGCTVVLVVPHRFDPIDGITYMLLFGPIHLAAVVALTWVSRLIDRVLTVGLEAKSPEPAARGTGGRIAFAFAVLATAAAFPYAFRAIAIEMDFRRGAATADALWADHSAFILCNPLSMLPRKVGIYDIYASFDADSGLPRRREMGHEYETGYKARIRQLLATHGVPSWSHKGQLVSDADLVGMLTAKDMTPVTSYPYDISPNAVLMRGGTVSRWGMSLSSGSDFLDIDTRLGGNFGAFRFSGDAAIGRMARYPGVIFVRGGDQWIAAVSDDGWILNSAVVSP